MGPVQRYRVCARCPTNLDHEPEPARRIEWTIRDATECIRLEMQYAHVGHCKDERYEPGPAAAVRALERCCRTR